MYFGRCKYIHQEFEKTREYPLVFLWENVFRRIALFFFLQLSPLRVSFYRNTLLLYLSPLLVRKKSLSSRLFQEEETGQTACRL